MNARRMINDQRGITFVEQIVGLGSALVVIFIISSAVVTTLLQSSRVSARVEATQGARLVVHHLVNELHSACVASLIAPVRAGSSSTSISFLHQTGSGVAPTPDLRTVTLAGGTLTEYVYPATGGTAPGWTFASTPSMTRVLSTGVSQISAGVPLFGYYSYSGGQVSTTPLPSPLSASNASRVVQVRVAVKVAPRNNPASDPNREATVQGTALLRFTPAEFSTSANNLPCE